MALSETLTDEKVEPGNHHIKTGETKFPIYSLDITCKCVQSNRTIFTFYGRNFVDALSYLKVVGLHHQTAATFLVLPSGEEFAASLCDLSAQALWSFSWNDHEQSHGDTRRKKIIIMISMVHSLLSTLTGILNKFPLPLSHPWQYKQRYENLISDSDIWFLLTIPCFQGCRI